MSHHFILDIKSDSIFVRTSLIQASPETYSAIKQILYMIFFYKLVSLLVAIY